MKNKKIQSLLYLYIILCPILDCTSFIFRNALNTNISPSTIIRPLFVIISSLYIFITDKKQRKIFILAGATYGIYAISHLYIFTMLKNNSSYSGIVHELQYLINYTFMVINLYVYIYAFAKEKDNSKIYKCILISASIYIVSIYISLLTGTSSYTYPEDSLGFKGWFESGNSLSAIFTFMLFLLLNIFNKREINKKVKYYTGVILGLICIFLILLIGTRTGLLGVILAFGIYGIAHLISNIINKVEVKKTLMIFGTLVTCGVIILILFGSQTLNRRKNVEDMANGLVNEETNQKIYITGDLYLIKSKIENGTLEQDYMSVEQQNAVLKLDEIATKYKLSIQKMRTLQLIYNIELINNQSNILYKLFGNGYVCQFYEMILEMEFVAILINFGVYGFILYLVPFIIIYGYSFIKGMKNIEKIDVEYIMLLMGGGLAFALSLLSGYIFFNASTTMLIILIDLLLYRKVQVNI